MGQSAKHLVDVLHINVSSLPSQIFCPQPCESSFKLPFPFLNEEFRAPRHKATCLRMCSSAALNLIWRKAVYENGQDQQNLFVTLSELHSFLGLLSFPSVQWEQ